MPKPPVEPPTIRGEEKTGVIEDEKEHGALPHTGHSL